VTFCCLLYKCWRILSQLDSEMLHVRSIAVEKLVMSCLVSVQGLVKAGVVGFAFAGQMLSV